MDELFAGVAVADFPRAAEWYGRLFGRDADVVAHDREVMWQVTGTGWLYVVEDAARAGRGLVAIAVPDLDEAGGRPASPGHRQQPHHAGGRRRAQVRRDRSRRELGRVHRGQRRLTRRTRHDARALRTPRAGRPCGVPDAGPRSAGISGR